MEQRVLVVKLPVTLEEGKIAEEPSDSNQARDILTQDVLGGATLQDEVNPAILDEVILQDETSPAILGEAELQGKCTVVNDEGGYLPSLQNQSQQWSPLATRRPR